MPQALIVVDQHRSRPAEHVYQLAPAFLRGQYAIVTTADDVLWLYRGD